MLGDPKGGYASLIKLVNFLAVEAVEWINSHFVYETRSLCQVLTLGEILKAYGMKINSKNEAIKIEFSVANNPSVRFEVLAQIVGKMSKLPGKKSEGNPFSFVHYIIKRQYRFVYVARLDSYKGPCEQAANDLDITAQYCLCHDQLFKDEEER